jgi:hypothetical protein
MYNTLLPNIVSGLGVVLLLVGAILLLGAPDRFGKSRRGALRLVWAFVILELAVVLWIGSLWIDGTAWLPGRIIASVAVVAGLVFAVPRIRQLARRAKRPTVRDESAYEPWTPRPEDRERWERLGRLRDLVEGAAWGRPIDDPAELARRVARRDGVIAAMAEMAPEGYFHD